MTFKAFSLLVDKQDANENDNLLPFSSFDTEPHVAKTILEIMSWGTFWLVQ
jgi:hypothetical protein